jgi:predicted metal-dependent hydrolase
LNSRRPSEEKTVEFLTNKILTRKNSNEMVKHKNIVIENKYTNLNKQTTKEQSPEFFNFFSNQQITSKKEEKILPNIKYLGR